MAYRETYLCDIIVIYLVGSRELHSTECSPVGYHAVTSGVPHGAILSPFLFLVFGNDRPDYIENGSRLALFSNDHKLYRTLDWSTSTQALQYHIDSLVKWNVNSNMSFSASTYKTLHISEKIPINAMSYHLGYQTLKRISHVKDL